MASTLLSKWEKAKIVSVILATVVIPLAVALVGNWYSKALKEREIQVRYVEIALEILSKEPTEKNTYLRQWAIDVIDFYSDIKVPKEARDELVRERIDLSSKRAKEIIDQIGR
jgi:hypothetical protein